MTRELLKECPFCGEAPIEHRTEPHKHFIAQMPDYPGSWEIECMTCEFRIFDHDSRENAVAKWNRRAALASPEPEPVAWACICQGRVNGNMFTSRAEAEKCLSGLNERHPGIERSVVPLFTSPPEPDGTRSADD